MKASRKNKTACLPAIKAIVTTQRKYREAIDNWKSFFSRVNLRLRQYTVTAALPAVPVTRMCCAKAALKYPIPFATALHSQWHYNLCLRKFVHPNSV